MRRHAVINCGSRAVKISEIAPFIRFSRNMNNIKSPNYIYIFYVFPRCITNLIKTTLKNQLLFEALTWLNVCSMELSLLFIVLKEILCPMCNLKPGKLKKLNTYFFQSWVGVRYHASPCVGMRWHASFSSTRKKRLATVTVFQRLRVTPLRLTNSCLAIVRDEQYQNFSVPYCVINAVAHAPALIG